MVSREIYQALLFNHEKKGFLSYLRPILVITSGTLMKKGYFGKFCLIVALDQREKNVKEVCKKSKHRFTVAFFATASRKKEIPIVIWKSQNPRCFKKLTKHSYLLIVTARKRHG